MLRSFILSFLLLMLTDSLVHSNNVFNSTSHPAPFVWINDHGEGRQVYVLFRNDFELSDLPNDAKINLFADSRYHLIVNGTFINFGPVRFYPAHPQYDSYDITPYLIKGHNAIVVKVLSNGMNTFQIPKSIGGFTAWGEIKTKNKRIPLNTPGKWKCKEMNTYDKTSPKMSFATGPIEVYDARKEIKNWNKPDLDTNDWLTPVTVKNQDHWGRLTKRHIPHLTQDEILPKSIKGKYHLRSDEDIYSFRVKLPDLTRDDLAETNWLYAYTYIYSPIDQFVDVGLWWGEYWLNGRDVKPDFTKTSDRNVLNYATLDLKEGWNFFFVTYGVFQSLWDFHMTVPKSADLELSNVKEKESPHVFMTLGPFQEEVLQTLNQKEIPFTQHEMIPELSLEWDGQDRNKNAGNPAWEMAWKVPHDPLPHAPHQIRDIKVKSGLETAIVLDMGGKQLGRIFVDYSAPAGTVVDVAFTEDLRNGVPSIIKRPGIFTATRHISNGGPSRLETFKPYGSRYLQINVTQHQEEVIIHKAGVISQVYPFEKAGSFTCSDPMFNAIWELGWRTLRVCSEDTYTDTPYRERGLYAGDALPEFAITLATSGDGRLIKRSLEVFQDMYSDLFFPGGEKPEDTPGLLYDFPFITLEYFRWYIDWTDDIEFAQKLYPSYQYMVEQAIEKRQKNGLFMNLPAFVEWTKIDKSAQLTMMQALMARSFENMSALAEKLNLDNDKEKYNILNEETIDAINKHCWDPQKGAYRDGFKNNVPIDNYYPISSAWMSLTGYNDSLREEKLDAFYKTELKDIGNISRNRKSTPYGGFYILGALYRHENAGIAENYIRKYWSPMILKHDDTAWENFDDGTTSDSGQGTLSHAWSGGPTYYLTTEILGVKLGFPYMYNPDTIYIEPQSESVNWAKGKVPHPKGMVEVEWQLKGNILFLNYNAPKETRVVIKPKGRLAHKKLIINKPAY